MNSPRLDLPCTMDAGRKIHHAVRDAACSMVKRKMHNCIAASYASLVAGDNPRTYGRWSEWSNDEQANNKALSQVIV